MCASTPEKAFLRFLYLLDQYYVKKDQSVELSYVDVVLLMKQADPSDKYGFSLMLEDRYQAQVISVNQSLSLAKFRRSEGGRILVEITELGRGFGSQLAFPDELEEAIERQLAGRK